MSTPRARAPHQLPYPALSHAEPDAATLAAAAGLVSPTASTNGEAGAAHGTNVGNDEPKAMTKGRFTVIENTIDRTPSTPVPEPADAAQVWRCGGVEHD